MNMNQKQIRLMVILISGVIFLSSQTQANIFFPLSSIGYSFGGAGVRASFVGIEWHYDLESAQVDLRPDTKFYFDADDPMKHAPNIVGEMTNAFVPEQEFAPQWVLSDWVKSSSYIKNPLRSETWELENPDNPDEILAYECEEWLLRLYLSITCEWDNVDLLTTPVSEFEGGWQRYRDTEVWIELDLAQDFFVFEGSPTPYFAIGKVKCSEFATGKLGSEDKIFDWRDFWGNKKEGEYTPTDQFSVIPETESWMYLYYNKWGQKGQVQATDPFTFKGRVLNPEIFTDKMFFSVNLANFGTQYDAYLDFSTLTKGDAVTWAFDVYVYVVGEWKIKDISELPEQYGREPMVDYQQSWVSGMLSDPRFQLWSFIGAIALVVLLLAIFAPWVLFAIVGLFKSGKK